MLHDLQPDRIRSSLRGRFGTPLELHESIDSTNRRGLEWAEAGAPHGATVVADVQSAGRGRRGRAWRAAPGSGLLFSVVIRATAGVPWGLLPTAAGVAVARCLKTLGPTEVTLKWPNDVLLGGAKVCGVLVESRGAAPAGSYAVVGVGLNVRGSSTELTEAFGRPVTALVPEHLADASRADILGACLNELDDVWSDVEDGRASSLIAAATRLSAVIGRDLVLRLPDGSARRARAQRLREDGALEVADQRGTWVVTSGEIERVEEVGRERLRGPSDEPFGASGAGNGDTAGPRATRG